MADTRPPAAYRLPIGAPTTLMEHIIDGVRVPMSCMYNDVDGLVSSYLDKLKSEREALVKRSIPVHVPCYCSPVVQDRLYRAFPEFPKLVFTGSRTFGAAMRENLNSLIQRYLVNQCSVTGRSIVGYGTEFAVDVLRGVRRMHHCMNLSDVVIASNYATQMTELRNAVASPGMRLFSRVSAASFIVKNSTPSRQADYEAMILKRLRDSCPIRVDKDKLDVRRVCSDASLYAILSDAETLDEAIERYGEEGPNLREQALTSMLCRDACACTAKGYYVVVNHNVVNMSPYQVAELMEQHGSETAYGAFLFDPEMFHANFGEFPSLGGKWEVRADGKLFIYLDGDCGVPNVYERNEYLLHAKVNRFELRGVTYVREMNRNHAGVWMYVMRRIATKPRNPGAAITHRIHFPSDRNTATIKSFVPKKGRYDLMSPDAYEPVTVKVPLELLHSGQGFAAAVEKLDWMGVFILLATRNYRLVAEYSHAFQPKSVSVDVLCTVTTAVVAEAYMARWSEARMISILRQRHVDAAALQSLKGTAWFWVSVCALMKQPFKKIGDSIDDRLSEAFKEYSERASRDPVFHEIVTTTPYIDISTTGESTSIAGLEVKQTHAMMYRTYKPGNPGYEFAERYPKMMLRAIREAFGCSPENRRIVLETLGVTMEEYKRVTAAVCRTSYYDDCGCVPEMGSDLEMWRLRDDIMTHKRCGMPGKSRCVLCPKVYLDPIVMADGTIEDALLDAMSEDFRSPPDSPKPGVFRKLSGDGIGYAAALAIAAEATVVIADLKGKNLGNNMPGALAEIIQPKSTATGMLQESALPEKDRIVDYVCLSKGKVTEGSCMMAEIWSQCTKYVGVPPYRPKSTVQHRTDMSTLHENYQRPDYVCEVILDFRVLTGEKYETKGVYTNAGAYYFVGIPKKKMYLTKIAEELRDRFVVANDALGVDLVASYERAVSVSTLFENPGPIQEAGKVAVPTIRNIPAVIEHAMGELIPGIGTIETRYDQYNAFYADYHFNQKVNRLIINPMQLNALPTKRVQRANLGLPIMQDRIPDMKGFLAAAAARNLNVPVLAVPHNYWDAVTFVFWRFVHVWCVPGAADIIKGYFTSKFRDTEETIAQRIALLPDRDLEAIAGGKDDVDFSLNLQQLGELRAKTKEQVKPKLDITVRSVVPAPQVIMYRGKETVIPASAAYMTMLERVESLLRPEVLMQCKKSREDIDEHIQRFGRGAAGKYFECDMSQYDKSQQLMCFKLEFGFYYMMGLDVEFLDNWIRGCMVKKVSADVGVRLFVTLQRTSGSSTTTLGNTLMTMMAIAATYEIPHYSYAMFIGDDFIMKSSAMINQLQVGSELRWLFNLTAKTIETTHGYFASMYIIDKPGLGGAMSDPIKRALALRDLSVQVRTHKKRDGGGTSYISMVGDRYQSFKDLMRHYDDYVMLEALDEAVAIRYSMFAGEKRPASSMVLLIALSSAAASFEAFCELFQEEVTTIRG